MAGGGQGGGFGSGQGGFGGGQGGLFGGAQPGGGVSLPPETGGGMKGGMETSFPTREEFAQTRPDVNTLDQVPFQPAMPTPSYGQIPGGDMGGGLTPGLSGTMGGPGFGPGGLGTAYLGMPGGMGGGFGGSGLSGTMGGPGFGPGGLGTAYLGMPGGVGGVKGVIPPVNRMPINVAGGSLAKGPAQMPPNISYAGGTPFFNESTGQYTRPTTRPINIAGGVATPQTNNISSVMDRFRQQAPNQWQKLFTAGPQAKGPINPQYPGLQEGVKPSNLKPGTYFTPDRPGPTPNPGNDPRYPLRTLPPAGSAQGAYNQELAQYNSPEYAAYYNSLAPSTRAYMHAPGNQQTGQYLADQARANWEAYQGKDPFSPRAPGMRAGGIASLLKRR